MKCLEIVGKSCSTLYGDCRVKKRGRHFSELFAVFGSFLQCILGKFLLKGLHFFTLPLLTFYISRQEMGFYQLLSGGMGIFVEIATLGTRQHYSVAFFKHHRVYSRAKLIAANLWLYLRVTTVFFLLLFLIMGWQIERGSLVIFLLLLIHSYLNVFNELHVMTTKFYRQFLKYHAISFFFGGLQVGMVVVFVTVFKHRLLGFATALLITELLQLIYSALNSKRWLSLLHKMGKREVISPKKIVPFIKKSSLFIPSTLSFWLLMNVDQWMLGKMLGLESVGLYAFAGKFSLLFDYLISSSLILVYTPFFYQKLHKNPKQAGWNNSVVAGGILAGSIVICLLASQSLFLLQSIIAAHYYPALKLIPPLICVACIRLATHLLQLPLKFKQCLFFIIWSNLAVAGTNALLNTLWIPQYGIEGCLMASITSFLLLFFLSLTMSMIQPSKNLQPKEI